MPEQRLAGLNTRVTGADRDIGQAMGHALGQEEANGSGHDRDANDGACEKDPAPYVSVNVVAPGYRETDRTRAAGAGSIASVVPATP
jgi:NAD(P)-dependent dehydrogenase (short-subunit alcohol dehydrogenase family)